MSCHQGGVQGAAEQHQAPRTQRSREGQVCMSIAAKEYPAVDGCGAELTSY